MAPMSVLQKNHSMALVADGQPNAIFQIPMASSLNRDDLND
jgi:hypothetical protein